MNTIEEMWKEYEKNAGLDNPMDEENPNLRNAFFAGFNRGYNVMNQESCVLYRAVRERDGRTFGGK